MIVWDGGVRACRRNRLEGQILQFAGLLAEPFELGRRIEFGHLAVWRLALEPAQEAAHGDAIAALGAAGTFLLDGVLARLGQDARVGARCDGGLGFRQHFADAVRRPGGIDQHA